MKAKGILFQIIFIFNQEHLFLFVFKKLFAYVLALISFTFIFYINFNVLSSRLNSGKIRKFDSHSIREKVPKPRIRFDAKGEK